MIWGPGSAAPWVCLGGHHTSLNLSFFILEVKFTVILRAADEDSLQKHFVNLKGFACIIVTKEEYWMW